MTFFVLYDGEKRRGTASRVEAARFLRTHCPGGMARMTSRAYVEWYQGGENGRAWAEGDLPEVPLPGWLDEITLEGDAPELWCVLTEDHEGICDPVARWVWKQLRDELVELCFYPHKWHYLRFKHNKLVGAIRLPVPPRWRSMMPREASAMLEKAGLT